MKQKAEEKTNITSTKHEDFKLNAALKNTQKKLFERIIS